MRFGTEQNFDQHSDANSGAIGANIMNKLAKLRSYCELNLIVSFENFYAKKNTKNKYSIRKIYKKKKCDTNK